MKVFLPICLMFFSYLLGSISFGILIGKLKGVDIRNYGSHNIGATNALRVLGPALGILVFILDFSKGAIPIIITKYIINWPADYPTYLIHPLIYGILAIIGHLFPVFLKFKGGKGISCFAGVMVLYCWQISVIAFLTFIIVFLITKIVSISSMLASLMLIVSYFILGIKDIPLLVMISLMFVLIVYKHRSNIMRLIKGEENKIDFSKKEK